MSRPAPVPPRTSAESRSGLCNCGDPCRPLSHESGCPAVRPLKDWTDREIAVELDEAERKLFYARRGLDRARCREGRAYEYHRKTVAAVERARKFIDHVDELRRAIHRERALRENHPFVVSEG